MVADRPCDPVHSGNRRVALGRNIPPVLYQHTFGRWPICGVRKLYRSGRKPQISRNNHPDVLLDVFVRFAETGFGPDWRHTVECCDPRSGIVSDTGHAAMGDPDGDWYDWLAVAV